MKSETAQATPFTENFRGFLERLREAKELLDVRQPVDIRHVATLVDQCDKELYFHNVIGYNMPLVSGILRSRERATMSLACSSHGEIEVKLQRALDNPIAPRRLKTSPTKEVIQRGDQVDLFRLPVPMSSIHDGGPMIIFPSFPRKRESRLAQ